MFVTLTDQAISTNEAFDWVRHPSCGAVVSFEGNIRIFNDGKKVFALEYEVYENLFHAEVKRIIDEIHEQWPIGKFALIQRIGKLDVGETGLLIVLGAPHRKEALEALSYAIEEFKKRAPVWKKEYYDGGNAWIHCRHGGKNAAAC